MPRIVALLILLHIGVSFAASPIKGSESAISSFFSAVSDAVEAGYDYVSTSPFLAAFIVGAFFVWAVFFGASFLKKVITCYQSTVESLRRPFLVCALDEDGKYVPVILSKGAALLSSSSTTTGGPNSPRVYQRTGK